MTNHSRRRVRVKRDELVKLFAKRDSLAFLLYGILRFLFIIVQNIYLVSTYLILTWFILIPVSWLNGDLYSRLENYLYNFLMLVVSSWGMGAGITVVETGDEYKHLIEPGFACNVAGPSGCGDRFGCGGAGAGEDEQSGRLLQSGNTHENDLKPPAENLESTVKHTSGTSDQPDTLTNNNQKHDDSQYSNSHPLNNSTAIGHQYNHLRHQPQDSVETTKPKVLLLCNHISTADVLLIMQSFSEMTSQSNLWVLDAAFKLTNFGIVCGSHGDFFIAKNSFKDGLLRDQTLKHPDRNLLVLFPEGGFWRKRLEGSNRFASKNNLPPTRYVTHPRFGAFRDFMHPSVGVTHIVDATLIYNDIENPLSILDIVLGTKREPVILNYKVYSRDKTNFTDAWLRDIWLEKDKLIEQFYEDRNKVYDKLEATMRTFKMDWLKLVSVHIFYLLVFYLTVYRLFNATSVTMLKARELYYSNI